MVKSHSNPDRSYTVLVNPYVNKREFVCDCTGFEFRGECRHQFDALKKVCWWPIRPDIESLEQSPIQELENTCPNCGGLTKYEVRAADAS